MCEQGSPYKIHAKGCQGIIQYREEVELSAPTINDLECLTWVDQIAGGSMTKESVKGTVHICPCAVGVWMIITNDIQGWQLTIDLESMKIYNESIKTQRRE